jgi:hypothetical protein
MRAGESGGHRYTSRLPDEPSLSTAAGQIAGRYPPRGGDEDERRAPSTAARVDD